MEVVSQLPGCCAQPGFSTMDEIMEEAAEDAEAAVESAQQHSSEDIVNVSLIYALLSFAKLTLACFSVRWFALCEPPLPCTPIRKTRACPS